MPPTNTRLNTKNTRSLDGDFVWKTVDQYYQTYWSGLDARIYANDVLIDEILSLQFQLQEAVAPLFSYASYTYDTLMHGARRVTGAFSINFKRESYIYELLRLLRKAKPGNDRVLLQRDSEARRIAESGTATVEDFTALAAGGGNTKIDKAGRVQFDPALFNEIAQDFEDAIWRRPDPKEQNTAVSRLVDTLSDSARLDRPKFEVDRRFNLEIQFSSTGLAESKKRKVAGGPEPLGNTQIPVTTSTVLLGVALTGVERSLDDSGRPIMETYTFIARDVV